LKDEININKFEKKMITKIQKEKGKEKAIHYELLL
jgi:hypothetical protein